MSATQLSIGRKAYFESLSNVPMRKEIHTNQACCTEKVYGEFNNEIVYVFVRVCYCNLHNDKTYILEKLSAGVPQDGLDVHGNKACKYHQKTQFGQNGKIFVFEVECYCDTPNRTRRAADYIDP